MEVNLSDEHNNILLYFVIAQLFMQQSHTTCSGTIKGASVKTNSGVDLKSHTHTYKEAQNGSNPTVVIP